jgi:response regulator NasT
MKNKGLTEDEAYRLMRGAAMRENKKIADIAHAIVTAAELLK